MCTRTAAFAQPHTHLTSLRIAGSKIAFRCLCVMDRDHARRGVESVHEPSAPAVSYRGREELAVRGWVVEHDQSHHHHSFLRHTTPKTQSASQVTAKLVGTRLRAPRFNSWGDTHSSYDCLCGGVVTCVQPQLTSNTDHLHTHTLLANIDSGFEPDGTDYTHTSVIDPLRCFKLNRYCCVQTRIKLGPGHRGRLVGDAC
jgi:hypothetical protein